MDDLLEVADLIFALDAWLEGQGALKDHQVMDALRRVEQAWVADSMKMLCTEHGFQYVPAPRTIQNANFDRQPTWVQAMTTVA